MTVLAAGHPLGVAVLGARYAYLNLQNGYVLFTSAEIPQAQLGDVWSPVLLPPVQVNASVQGALDEGKKGRRK